MKVTRKVSATIELEGDELPILRSILEHAELDIISHMILNGRGERSMEYRELKSLKDKAGALREELK